MEPYSLGDDIVTIDDISEMVRAYSKDGEILMLSGSQIDSPESGTGYPMKMKGTSREPHTRVKTCGGTTAGEWLSSTAT